MDIKKNPTGHPDHQKETVILVEVNAFLGLLKRIKWTSRLHSQS